MFRPGHRTSKRPCRYASRTLLLAAIACALTACGIKGPLQPPPTVRPQGSPAPEVPVPAPNAPNPGQQPPAPIEPRAPAQ